MRFCIIGAGNGGRAFAAYLSSKGYSVNLYNRSFTRISDIKKKGGIKAKGELKGFFPIDFVTQDFEFSLKDSDVILIVTPASAHKEIAEKIAPFLSSDQIIILNPGRTFGAVEFQRTIERKMGNMPLFIAETQTLLFTSRQLKKNGVRILKIKDSIGFCAFPERHNFFIYDTLKDVFPQLNPKNDYLEVTLNNIGMLLHPTLSLMNASAMDYGKGFKFYKEGVTQRSCAVLEAIEVELNDIFAKLALKQFRYCDWVKQCYNVDSNSIYEAIQNVQAYDNIKAPKTLATRYFTEDVPTGLVPISSLAKFLGIGTPIIDSVINLSSILCCINFWKEGRTIEKLNLKKYIRKRLAEEKFLDVESRQKLAINV